MRYAYTEETVLVGQLQPGDTVTIKIIDLATDNLITTTTTNCIESQHIAGMFMFSTINIDKNTVSSYANLLYEMTSSTGEKAYGKFIYGGYLDNPITIDNSAATADHAFITDLLELINARI